jgi:hypothetical protein
MPGNTRRGLRNLILISSFLGTVLYVFAAGNAAEPADGARSAHTPAPRTQIGRIFFSPAERRARRGGESKAAPLANGIAPSERFLIDGAVSSSSKGRAVWINGAPVENSAARKSAWTDRDGNIWFSYESLGTRQMRAGQTIDRSGKIEDLLPAGAVTRH